MVGQDFHARFFLLLTHPQYINPTLGNDQLYANHRETWKFHILLATALANGKPLARLKDYTEFFDR
jgi:hypothetical protein